MSGDPASQLSSLDNIPDRFIIELEFVQNLSNPSYLHFLAQRRYFEDEAFMQFLAYLQYWKSPEYLRFIVFPQCLAFLDALINNPRFRKELAIPAFAEYLHKQQGLHWMFDASLAYSKSTRLMEQEVTTSLLEENKTAVS